MICIWVGVAYGVSECGRQGIGEHLGPIYHHVYGSKHSNKVMNFHIYMHTTASPLFASLFNETPDCFKAKLNQVPEPLDNLAWLGMIETRIIAKGIHAHEPHSLPSKP